MYQIVPFGNDVSCSNCLARIIQRHNYTRLYHAIRNHSHISISQLHHIILDVGSPLYNVHDHRSSMLKSAAQWTYGSHQLINAFVINAFSCAKISELYKRSGATIYALCAWRKNTNKVNATYPSSNRSKKNCILLDWLTY